MVYKFVVLSDEDESFMREFEFLDSQTLLDFHNQIQEELEFDKSQMASFFMATDNWEKEEEFTLFDMGTGSSTMEDAVLEDIIFHKNQKLIYVFDFFNDRSLFIEYTGEADEIDGREYPVCSNSKGIPPKQVVFGSSSKKLYRNIIVSDDEDDDDESDMDDLFLDDDSDMLPDFDNDETLIDDEDED
ncbi:MAG: plasmid pRiA4b ORF-3 family protein [Bacteroidales bacterium]|nr:plasmid pRiA4b ORF-3 family protein [Bacteroidales bacterium]